MAMLEVESDTTRQLNTRALPCGALPRHAAKARADAGLVQAGYRRGVTQKSVTGACAQPLAALAARPTRRGPRGHTGADLGGDGKVLANRRTARVGGCGTERRGPGGTLAASRDPPVRTLGGRARPRHTNMVSTAD